MTNDEEFGERLRTGLHDLAASAPPPTPPANVGRPPLPWRRPRQVAVAAVVLAVAGAVAAFAYGQDSSRSQVHTLASSSSAPEATTTTQAAVVTSETSSETPTSDPSTTSASSSSNGPAADCTADDLEAITAADKPTYVVGETVTITVTIRNRSGHPCVVRPEQRYPYTFGSPVKITDVNGALVWRRGARATGSFALVDPFVLAAGDSYDWATTQWNQHFCQGHCAVDAGGTPYPPDPSWDEGTQVPPGTYNATPADETSPPASSVLPATFDLAP
jgi:hypothetical protein